MPVADELAAIKEQGRQIKAALSGVNQFRSLYINLTDIEDNIEAIKAEGRFDQIPTDLKQALNRIYQMILQLKTDIEADPAFGDLIQ